MAQSSDSKAATGEDPCLLALGGWDDAEHSRECSMKGCVRCKWLKYKDTWKKQVPWLDASVNPATGTWGLGCRVCELAHKQTPQLMERFLTVRHHFARFQVAGGDIRLQRFQKHGKCPAHQAADRLANSKTPTQVNEEQEDLEGEAPSHCDWKALVENTAPGSVTADIPAVGKRKKVSMMRWCLAEAIRKEDREFLARAECISLQQDVRGTRFLVRFRTVDNELAVRTGVFQLTKLVASPDLSGAVALRQATMASLLHFCSERLPPSYASRKPVVQEQKPDFDLAKSLVHTVEAIAADAAADEQLAIQEMANISGNNLTALTGVYAQSFKNLKARLS